MSHCSNNVANEGGGAIELTDADRLRLLAAEQRRAALEVLADRTLPVDLDTLAAAVAARVGDIEGDDERVAIALHHNHLPKLSEFDVIDYDPDSNRVESRCSRIHSLEP